MEHPLTYLKQRAGDDWLIGYETNQFNHLTEQLFQQLTEFSQGKTPPKILLAESNPLRFLAAFLAAVAANCPVFLCNPNWVEQEWQQVFELVQPDLIFGQADLSKFPIPNSPFPIPNSPFPIPNSPFPIPHSQFPIPHSQFPIPHYSFPNQIMIPTGGSSGKIRFAIHTWETLMASVQGFHQYFGEKPINSFCVLPLYHVSGLMQFLRSFTTGGRLVILPFKALIAGEGQDIEPKEFFLSLVPTQLARLISLNSSLTPPCLREVRGERDVGLQNRNNNSSTSAWLSRFRTVLLGGAPAWAELLEQARCHNIPLAPTYGMTETASQVVTLKPQAFLAGNNSCGQVLPHAQVTIRRETGEILGTNQTGIITIQADSLALGYYPINLKPKLLNLTSDDLGFFDEQGYLHIVGRCSHKIITGGENVFPAEVEATIRATQLVTDVCVIGLPDKYWGQVVTAVYVPTFSVVSPSLLQTAVEDKLSKYKQPKYWVSVESLPRNAQGKVNYEQLNQVAKDSLKACF